jgi:hypothetical protein
MIDAPCDWCCDPVRDELEAETLMDINGRLLFAAAGYR